MRTLLCLLIALALLAPTLDAHAESWCAEPLIAHEWGVQVFSGAGGAAQATPHLPGFFHTATVASTTAPINVRDLPPDPGIRALPVLHFYGRGGLGGSQIPVGVEVGFAQGEASVWFPQIDTLTPAAVANSPVASKAREALVAARAARQPFGVVNTPLPADPTRQLIWNNLTLTEEPPQAPSPPDVNWVESLREVESLWVTRGVETERFVFYEAITREAPPLRVERAPGWSAATPRYVLHNDGEHAVHDLFVVHRDDAGASLFHAASVAAKGQVVVEMKAMDAPEFLKATHDHLATRLVSPSVAPPTMQQGCVEMRDPARPVEAAVGHQLEVTEAEALLEVWSARFFKQKGTVIVYREDIAQLDAVMPMSLYTDMYHFITLHRAGLVLWQDIDLEVLSGGKP